MRRLLVLMVLALLLAGCGGTGAAPASTPAPTFSVKQYTDWLATETRIWNQGGTQILESIYPNGSYQIIWLRTTGLTQAAAGVLCDNVASDYVAQFHQDIIVHVFGPSGFSNELTHCSKSP